MDKLVTPTINLNGNTAESLVEQLRTVIDAARLLKTAIAAASDVTHGRNFQTALDPVKARIDATHAWGERWAMIDRLEDEMTDLALAIQKQGRNRA